MARRLPWATDADSPGDAKRKRTPVQRARHEPRVSSDDDPARTAKPHQSPSTMKTSSQALLRKRETSRTPSTSPPPAPPATELMHEGYDADDIFMIVEDEFQTVAQSFTHHLHHAEYVRMKKKARTAPPPTSAIPPNSMRAETRNKLEAKDLSSRQNTAIKDMIGGTGLASPEEEEEEKANDPWQGTSLAGLMSKDGSQTRTALVGLAQIPSSTRAARGFGRGEADIPTKREEHKSILEIFGGKGSRWRVTPPSPQPPIEASTEEEDDNLDTWSRIKPVVTNGKLRSLEPEQDLNRKTRIHPTQPSNKSTNLTSPPDSRSGILTKSKVGSTTSRIASKYSASSTRRTIDDFDDIRDDDLEDFSASSRSVFSSTSKTRAKGNRTKEKDKKSRLNEIPTFLV